MDPENKRDKEADENGNEEEKKEEKKKVKDETMKTLEIPGLRSFVEAKSKTAKIFWMVLLLVALAVFIWQLYKTITNYINSPIVSTYTITTVPAMDFPIVYICPTAFISSQYLNTTPEAEYDALALKEEMGIVWDYMDFLSSGNISQSPPQQSTNPFAHIDPPGFNALRNQSTVSEVNSTDRLMESELDAEDFFKEATVDLGNNVRYCEFRSFMFEKLPCENITREVLDPEYGKCYVVDVGGRQQTVQSQALVMTYNVRSQWYPKSSLSPLFNGVYVSVQRKYNVDQSGQSIILTPGTYYRVDLSAQHQVFESFQHPYKQECVQNDSYPQFNIFNVSYTQQSCLYDCAAQTIKRSCQCVPPIDRSLFKDGVTNTSNFCKVKHLQCIREIMNNRSAVDELKTCRAKCQRPCEDWRYSIRATSMDLYKYGLPPGVPVHDLIYILVSFSQMEYTEFKQDNSKTPDQMIADIGGEASLWLGAGMLTLLQIPVVAISLCGGCCKKKAKKLTNKKNDGENGN